MDHDSQSTHAADAAATRAITKTMFVVCLVAGLSFVIVIFATVL